MKRTELTAGESYAYREGKYGSANRVIVVDPEKCYRFTRSWYRGEVQDGVRVIFPNLADVRWGMPRRMSEADAETQRNIVADDVSNDYKKARAQSDLDQMYDGEYEGHPVFRILPRKIIETWADHEAAQESTAKAEARLRVERAAKAKVLSEAVSRLPEELQEFVKQYVPSDHQLETISSWDAEKLLYVLLGEDKPE